MSMPDCKVSQLNTFAGLRRPAKNRRIGPLRPIMPICSTVHAVGSVEQRLPRLLGQAFGSHFAAQPSRLA